MDIRDEKFSHMDEDGNVTMVDVGAKAATRRVAIAEGVVEVNSHTMALLREKALPKGDVLTTAKIAGIMGAKRTSELIPMCHPLALSFVDVRFRLEGLRIFVECEARTEGKTGVEMEALTGVSVALLTVYDMCKAIDKRMVMKEIHLVEKHGGKSGDFFFQEDRG